MFPFNSKNFLAVDIGTTSIKMAEFGGTTKKPELRNYGWLENADYLERTNKVIQTSSLRISEKETTNLLKILISQVKPKTARVVASLPSFTAFITLLEMPLMPNEDTAKSVVFQARQFIPFAVSEVTIDWIKVGERADKEGTKKQQILLISVPNERIKSYREIFQAAGLKLSALEIESFSLTRALTNNDPTPSILVDIGGYSTNIAVAEGGFWKYNSHSDFAGHSLTQAVASGLSINSLRAEELKKRVGLIGIGGEYELSTLMFPFLDAIIQEVRRAKEIYEREYGGRIERTLLAGGGANLPGIEKYFTEQLGLTVVKGAPFNYLNYSEQITPLVNELGGRFAVAVGLGLKGI